MKKTASIFFISLYVLFLAAPFFPYIEYAINRNYIAQNLCENKDKPQMHCNGKCHLAKQLKKAATEESKNHSSPRTTSLEDYSTLFTENSFSINFNPFKTYSEVKFNYSENYSFQYFFSVFHPPTV